MMWLTSSTTISWNITFLLGIFLKWRGSRYYFDLMFSKNRETVTMGYNVLEVNLGSRSP